MAKKSAMNMARAIEANLLYQRADENWSAGRLCAAFRLFLAAAEAGMVPAFRIVGQFYDDGEGVQGDKTAALYWYRRAYRFANDASAANNIGCIWRDRGNLRRATWWFNRAVTLGDHEANLNIAKVCLRSERTLGQASHYLKKIVKSSCVTEGTKEEAVLLLKQIKNKQKDGARSRMFATC